MPKDTLRQIANILSVALAITVNVLAATLPLNGQNTGAISDRFKVYFVPAGYVFSIWGIIYIGWIAFAVYQALPMQKEDPRLRRLGYLFSVSGLFNAAWLFCWHYNQFGLSVLVMLILLGLLIVSYVELNVGRTHLSNAARWCVDIPFSVYLGWITVATVANISAWLYFVHWDGFGADPQLWAVLMLVVAAVIGGLMARTHHDAVFALVLVWAFIGIALKQAAAPLVASTAWITAVIAFGLALYSIFWRRRFSKQDPLRAVRGS